MVSMLFSSKGLGELLANWKAIQSFFNSGKLLKEVNTTAIALIPKVPNPSGVKDFRPISCFLLEYYL